MPAVNVPPSVMLSMILNRRTHFRLLIRPRLLTADIPSLREGHLSEPYSVPSCEEAAPMKAVRPVHGGALQTITRGPSPRRERAMARKDFWGKISIVSMVILATMSGTASAVVYGLKSAADSVDSTAPTYLFKFGETGGGVSGVREVKVGTARIDADGLAVSPSLGLYAFQLGSGSSRLLKINESTGAATPVGRSSRSESPHSRRHVRQQ